MQNVLDWARFRNHRNHPPSWVLTPFWFDDFVKIVEVVNIFLWSHFFFSLVVERGSTHECVTFFKIFNGNWFWASIDIQQIAEHGEKDPIFLLPWTIITTICKMFYVSFLSALNDFCKSTGYIFCVSIQDSFMPYYTSWHDTFGFGKLFPKEQRFRER